MSPAALSVAAFVDLSNIWLGLLDEADRNGEWRSDVRLAAANFRDLLRAGRPLGRGVVVANASIPPAALEHYGVFGEVITREPGRQSGTEQANDETLQVRIYETIFDRPPGVLVLATGDGAGLSVRRGFIRALDAARRMRWRIEVVGWGDSTNSRLRSWLASTGGIFIDLSDHYYSISFIEGGRRVQPITLRHRAPAG